MSHDLPDTHEDNHVHSTFSDGAGTIAENIAAAEARGIRRLTCVDHVRRDTAWTPDFVAAVREANELTDVELRCGLEAKLLDTAGTLDLPLNLGGADYIYAADHQVPSTDGPVHPAKIREGLENGYLTKERVLTDILGSTANAVRLYENVVIAHLFSILPKIGLSEADVPDEELEGLATSAADNGARIEIDERWSCPSSRTLRPFLEAGVPILLSTDSHVSESIGVYDYCTKVVSELAG